jgi:hypothetical protein
MVYPWSNYNWDYAVFTDNNYNQKKTGISERPSLGALFSNINGMTKLNKGFTINSNPNSKSISAKSDLNQCDPTSSKYAGCTIINEIKSSIKKQKPPYNDPFFNRNLNGENSSSYFIRTSNCTKSNLNKEQCDKKGYQWVGNPLFLQTPEYLRPSTFISGNCYKPIYAFIKNRSGMSLGFGSLLKNKNLEIREIIANKLTKGFKGNIPSIMGDSLSLNPLLLNQVRQSKSTHDFEIMKCEPFVNCSRNSFFDNKNRSSSQLNIYLLLFLGFIILFTIYSFH